ncbi:MAG: glycosyltransferase [Candidatus Aenigmarchaeota archaeon]|nr:glycosyltransferase [Candidatus Aenigmarchaeota archaeon]
MKSEQEYQSIIEKILGKLKTDKTGASSHAENIVLISKDYVPKDVNEISLQVKTIAENLVQKGKNVHVITYDPIKAGQTTELGEVKVHYIGNSIRAYSPLTDALTLGMDINRVAADIFHEEDIDLIHVHDWYMLPAGVLLQRAFQRPMCSTYYSVENVRCPDVVNNYTNAIKEIENRGCNESRKVMVKENWLKDEIINQYKPEEEKVDIINPDDEKDRKKLMKDYRWVMQNYEEL